MIKLFYQEKASPANVGEGREVTSQEMAKSICREANRLFPEYTHWYEVRAEKAPKTK